MIYYITFPGRLKNSTFEVYSTVFHPVTLKSATFSSTLTFSILSNSKSIIFESDATVFYPVTLKSATFEFDAIVFYPVRLKVGGSGGEGGSKTHNISNHTQIRFKIRSPFTTTPILQPNTETHNFGLYHNFTFRPTAETTPRDSPWPVCLTKNGTFAYYF